MSDSDSEMEKQRKKERKAEKKRKRAQEEEQQAAAAASSSSSSAAAAAAAATPSHDAAADSDAERAAKKAKKAAKRAARDAEVIQAGAIALQEEADETAAAAAAAEVADAEMKESKKRHKKEKKEKAAAAAEPAAAAEEEAEETEEERQARKKAKKERKAREAAEAAAAASSSSSTPAASSSSSSSAAAAAAASSSSSASASNSDSAAAAAPVPAYTIGPDGKKIYPPPPPGNTTLLLFYQYVRPSWTAAERQNAENFTRDSLTKHGCTGRLRCAREGFNACLSGPAQGIRAFCQDLREYQPDPFAKTDFKLVDGLRDSQMLRGLKVWHVEELVTYGFDKGALKGKAVIEQGGTHLSPQDWHDRAAEDNTVLIDVRNANENAIGRFQPLNDAERVLDPNMRTSTEFPEWVDENMDKLKKAKNIMMYCTGGIRCERASALLVQKGLSTDKVFQLEGGIHRYLEAFPDGGHWVGKNYTFDRRFAHGATSKTPEVVGRCCVCTAPWDRYQAAAKCTLCRMEVLVCRDCERSKAHKGKTIKCHLCGGPKPSYLPASDKTLKFKKKKQYGEKAVDAEY